MVKAYIPLVTGPYCMYQDNGIIIIDTKNIIPISTNVVNPDYALYRCEENKGTILKIIKVIGHKKVENVSSINNTFHIGNELVCSTYNNFRIYKTFKAVYADMKYHKRFSGWCSVYRYNGSSNYKKLYYNGTLIKSIDKGNEIIIKRYYKKNYSVIKTLDGRVIRRFQGIFYYYCLESDIFYSWSLTNYGKETFNTRNKRTSVWYYKNNLTYCIIDEEGFRLESRSGLISKKIISLLQRIQSVVIKKNVKKIY
jgi:hypothetical protein